MIARARIAVIDLGPLLQKERDSVVARTAFFAAKLGLCRDTYLTPTDWSGLDGNLRRYHSSNFDTRKSAGVHIAYDELHRFHEDISLNPQFKEEISTEIRLAKRTGVSLNLLSQTSLSFGREAAMWASGVVLLGLPNQRRQSTVHDLGIREDFIDKIGQQLTGPGNGGVPFAFYTGGRSSTAEPVLNLNLSSTTLWAIASFSPGTEVRARLAHLVGFKRAVRALGKRFPKLDVGAYIDDEARRQARGSVEHSYKDLIEPITERLVAELATLA